MAESRKTWIVEYDHKDGRSGTLKVETKVDKSGAFEYGNGKAGLLTIGSFQQGYDLRYCHNTDLHMVMINEYFGKGLVSVTEI